MGLSRHSLPADELRRRWELADNDSVARIERARNCIHRHTYEHYTTTCKIRSCSDCGQRVS